VQTIFIGRDYLCDYLCKQFLFVAGCILIL